MKTELKKYTVKQVKKNGGRVKQFGRWLYSADKTPVLCQIKGCELEANWITNYKGASIALCFGHGEEV